MTRKSIPLFSGIQSNVKELLAETVSISAERKIILQQLSDYIQRKLEEEKVVRLNYICTHNSRRSIMSQIWAKAAAAYFQIPDVEVYSGGTESTAFNPRAVAAMERLGFKIERGAGENPVYQVYMADDMEPLACWSKTFDAAENPTTGFAAVMTCSDADENCPFIPGAEQRIALTFEDPKVADDTAEETARYDERARQIGRELIYAMQLVSKS